MAKISSLTDNTNQIVYPQTKANAVIMEDSTTVENAIAQRPKMVLSAEEPASTIADNTLYGVYGDVGQITTGEIADSAVTTAKIASSAVTEAKLGTGAVTADKLGSSSVTTAKIANGAVIGVTNSATSIGSAKLALNTVGTPNLRDGAVTSDKVDWTTMPKLAFEGLRSTISLSATSFTKIPFTSSSIVYDANYVSISNGIVTLQPGKYYITISCRWGDLSTNNNACLGFCINGVTTEVADADCLWSFTNERLSQNFSRVYVLTASKTFQGLAWTAHAASCKSVYLTIIRLA